MNALNFSAKQVASVTRSVSPLVIDMGRGWFGWIEKGNGFALDTRGLARWQPLVDVEVFGGSVMKPHQVDALVNAYGRPTP